MESVDHGAKELGWPRPANVLRRPILRHWTAAATLCTRAPIDTQLPVKCLSFWMVQRGLSQKLPKTYFQGHPPPEEVARRGTPGVETLKRQGQS